MKFKKTSFALAAAALCGASFATHAATPAPTTGTLEIWWKAPLSGATVSGTIKDTGCYVGGRGVSRVDFFIGSTLVSRDTTMADGMSCVLDTTKFANGSYTLTAVAYDSSGRTYKEPRSIKIQNAVSAPTTTPTTTTPTTTAPTTTTPTTTTVALPAPTTGTLEIWFKSPIRGATVSGQLALDKCYVAGRGVSRVEFFLDSTRLNTDTVMSDGMSCVLDTTKFANGTHTLKAVAYDSYGRSYPETTSINIQNTVSAPTTTPTTTTPTTTTPTTTTPTTTTPTTTTVALPAPTTGTLEIWFKSPVRGATVSGQLALDKCYVAGRGVSRVEFFLDSTRLNTDTVMSDGMSCVLDTTKFANGTHSLKAVAYDSSGRSYPETTSINIQNAVNAAPTVSITSPAAGATLSGTAAAFAANAADSDGTVSKVDVYVGATLVATKTAAPYSGTIDTTKLPNGAQTLMVVATDNKGASATTQRSVTISNVVSNPGGAVSAPTSGSIDPADILNRASADTAFSQQSGFNVQVIGTAPTIGTVAETGIHGSTLANGETLRFGKVVDPVNSAAKALLLQVQKNDPVTSGAKRTELRAPDNIGYDKVYWVALSLYVDDWGTLSTSDQALFGMQVHSGNNSLGLSPSLTLVTASGGDGRSFEVFTTHSTSTSPSTSTTRSARYGRQPLQFGRWMDFVFKFRHNIAGNGFAQVWMDGNLIADHRGNLGFHTPGYEDYIKFGYYNWSGSSMGSTARKVLLRNPTIVADPTGNKYAPEQLRALVSSGSSSVAVGSSTGSTTSTADSSGGGVCSTAICVVSQ